MNMSIKILHDFSEQFSLQQIAWPKKEFLLRIFFMRGRGQRLANLLCLGCALVHVGTLQIHQFFSGSFDPMAIKGTQINREVMVGSGGEVMLNQQMIMLKKQRPFRDALPSLKSAIQG